MCFPPILLNELTAENATITGEMLQEFRRVLRFTSVEFADLLRVSDETLHEWEASIQVPEEAMYLVGYTAWLVDLLDRFLEGKEEIGYWLRKPLLATRFEGSTPLGIIRRKEADRLVEWVYSVLRHREQWRGWLNAPPDPN